MVRRSGSGLWAPGCGLARGRALAVAGVALAVQASVAEAGGGGGGSSSGLSALASSSSVLCVATILIIISVLFERFEAALKEGVPRHARPVINALFGELTSLGVVGLLLFLAELSPVLTNVSESLFGKENSGALLHVIHEVHMVLFLVMLIFLVQTLFLVVLSVRLQRQWFHDETNALHDSGIDRLAVKSLETKLSATDRFLGALGCGKKASEQEVLIYAALRQRFVRPGGEEDALINADASAGPTLNADGLLTCQLNEHNAELFRKRFTVYAFQTSDPVHVKKHWGDSNGNRGDWVIVGLENDIYVCPEDVFTKSYVPVKGYPNQYRKDGTILALQMDGPFVAQTKDGAQTGAAGGYLVQETSGDGNQHSITEDEFLKTYEPANHGDEVPDHGVSLRRDFDFSAYLSHLMGHTLAEVVEIRVHTWLVMELLISIFWIIFNTAGSSVFAIAVLAGGYMLVGVVILLLHRLRWVRQQLLSPELFYRAQALVDHGKYKVHPVDHNSLVDSIPHLSDSQNVKVTSRSAPPFEQREIKVRSGCGARWFGRPANRHEQLFWFDLHGPHFHVHLITIIVLAMAIYISSAIVLFTGAESACTSTGVCVVGASLVAVPPVSLFILLPLVIKYHVMVANVEMMKKRYVIHEVVRQQKTVRSMRALRLLTAMNHYVMQEEADKSATAAGGAQTPHGRLEPLAITSADEETKSDPASGTEVVAVGHHPPKRSATVGFKGAAIKVYGGAKSAMYSRRRHELHEAFLLFDRDSSGSVKAEHVSAVLELVGIADNSAEVARKIVSEIDVDDTGAVEFEEFFDWMASKEASARDQAKELTDFIFRIIDRDHSGTITTAELRDTLGALGEVMSADDVHQIVRDADIDGNGVIDVHEFAEMMTNTFAHIESSL